LSQEILLLRARKKLAKKLINPTLEIHWINWSGKKIFNDFNAQSPQPRKSSVFIDFRAVPVLIECPASARLKSALKALACLK
jgi:hypothetical protein